MQTNPISLTGHSTDVFLYDVLKGTFMYFVCNISVDHVCITLLHVYRKFRSPKNKHTSMATDLTSSLT